MKGKWTYIQSQSLNQRVAFDENSGWLFCEDGTKYSPKELAKITKNWTEGLELPLSVHLLKKEFGGEIISVGKKHHRGELNGI